MKRLLPALAVISACGADPEKERLRETTRPTYDKQTGRLKELTYDSNRNGRIDTWTEMDGSRPVLTRIDQNEDGRIDRWEYYDDKGQLQKVGLSRKDDGRPDAWAYAGAGGKVTRVEVSSSGDPLKIDRWERYDESGLIAAEEDTNADGKPDKWETYENGAVRTAAFDENGDGTADRRLTYDGADLVAIESEPDASGKFTRRVTVK